MRLRLAALYVDTQRLEKTRDLLASTKTTTPEEAKWKKYLEARLLLSRDQAAPALVLFDEILGVRPDDQHREQHPEHLPESLLFAATYGAAEARDRPLRRRRSAEGHGAIHSRESPECLPRSGLSQTR